MYTLVATTTSSSTQLLHLHLLTRFAITIAHILYARIAARESEYSRKAPRQKEEKREKVVATVRLKLLENLDDVAHAQLGLCANP